MSLFVTVDLHLNNTYVNISGILFRIPSNGLPNLDKKFPAHIYSWSDIDGWSGMVPQTPQCLTLLPLSYHSESVERPMVDLLKFSSIVR